LATRIALRHTPLRWQLTMCPTETVRATEPVNWTTIVALLAETGAGLIQREGTSIVSTYAYAIRPWDAVQQQLQQRSPPPLVRTAARLAPISEVDSYCFSVAWNATAVVNYQSPNEGIVAGPQCLRRGLRFRSSWKFVFSALARAKVT